MSTVSQSSRRRRGASGTRGTSQAGPRHEIEDSSDVTTTTAAGPDRDAVRPPASARETIVERSPQLKRRTMSARSTVTGAIVAFVIFVLLASGSLVEIAEQQPFGFRRDVSLVLAKSIDRVSNLLSLNRPNDWVQGMIEDDTGGDGEFVFPSPETEEQATPSESADPATSEQATTTTTAPPEPIRQVTAADPLRIWVVGDSATEALGVSMEQIGDELGNVDVNYEFKLSSGWVRLDFFHWPRRIDQIAKESDPEAMVLFAGGNDWQDMTDEDLNLVAARGTQEWYDEYRRRIAGTMDLLKTEDDHRRVFWVGQPIMRNPDMDSIMANVNQIAAEEAAKRPWVEFVDTRPLLVDASGAYTDWLTLPDGSTVKCRQQDGVHVTLECTDLISMAVYDSLGIHWDFG